MFLKIINLILISLLIISAVALGFLLYASFFGESTPFIVLNKGNKPIVGNISGEENYPEGIMFYENLRFSEKQISYNIDSSCGEKKSNDAKIAFEILTENTILSFYEISGKEEILVSCDENIPKIDKTHFVAGEGGPTYIVNATNFNIIKNSTILVYDDDSCNKPIVTIHEILHAIGFKHSSYKNSIMYPIANCNQQITPEIIEKINLLYSIPALPDLTLEEIEAEKKGLFLNFKTSIVNAGLQTSSPTSLKIYSGEKEVVDYNIDKLEPGKGIFISGKNVKLLSSSEQLKFIIDENNLIKEIDENNNEVILALKN